MVRRGRVISFKGVGGRGGGGIGVWEVVGVGVVVGEGGYHARVKGAGLGP